MRVTSEIWFGFEILLLFFYGFISLIEMLGNRRNEEVLWGLRNDFVILGGFKKTA